MTIDFHDPYLASVLARSNMASPQDQPATLAEQLHVVCQPMAGYTDAILEVSKTGLHQTPDGSQFGTEDALLVLFRFELALAQERGIFKKRTDVRRVRYEEPKGVLADIARREDTKTGEFAIQFVGAGSVPLFRLAWGWWRPMLKPVTANQLVAATERDRILTAIDSATRRDFSA